MYLSKLASERLTLSLASAAALKKLQDVDAMVGPGRLSTDVNALCERVALSQSLFLVFQCCLPTYNCLIQVTGKLFAAMYCVVDNKKPCSYCVCTEIVDKIKATLVRRQTRFSVVLRLMMLQWLVRWPI